MGYPSRGELAASGVFLRLRDLPLESIGIRDQTPAAHTVAKLKEFELLFTLNINIPNRHFVIGVVD